MKKFISISIMMTMMSVSQSFASADDNSNQLTVDTGSRFVTIACPSSILMKSLKNLTQTDKTSGKTGNKIVKVTIKPSGLITISVKGNYLSPNSLEGYTYIQPSAGCLLSNTNKE